LTIELQVSPFDIWIEVKASNTIFPKSANVQKTFRISIVLLYDLVEPLIGISLHVFPLFTRLELNQDSHTLPSMAQTNVDEATTSSRFNREPPSLSL
jgi:hypothetical protein